ncbi:hypothetical protein BU23DRAFT_575923 [Bimuria novae-zelandiae CBS 107.79]|uniref:Uncharacterized protein n=1 Tax=Bimuria novae-zelandiae CBS 107.79 TaxID=1447943 RepID=A0A6A5UHP4_9PLEO|nr:hypothetical protein BU23DRAFT_575923 [Bimuria novae-zelandiae CBS 107.79]
MADKCLGRHTPPEAPDDQTPSIHSQKMLDTRQSALHRQSATSYSGMGSQVTPAMNLQSAAATSGPRTADTVGGALETTESSVFRHSGGDTSRARTEMASAQDQDVEKNEYERFEAHGDTGHCSQRTIDLCTFFDAAKDEAVDTIGEDDAALQKLTGKIEALLQEWNGPSEVVLSGDRSESQDFKPLFSTYFTSELL